METRPLFIVWGASFTTCYSPGLISSCGLLAVEEVVSVPDICYVLPCLSFLFYGRKIRKRRTGPIRLLSRSPSLNQLESELRFRSSLTEIGFPFRAIWRLDWIYPLSSLYSICFRGPCKSKLSKFMPNLSISDLTTNKSFSIVNEYGAINEFWQNRRST